MPAGEIYIGTSGWNYRHWANGRFYPPKLATRRWLAFYTTRYNTVEVNSSFYRIPTPESMRTWVETAPPGFRFALKIWRGITHYRKLLDCRDLLERYFAFAGGLEPAHRAPLLLQLPPNFGKDLPRLDAFIDDLRAVAGKRWSLAVEFRDASWLSPDTYRLLDRQHVSLALVDGRCPSAEPNATPTVYVRRHGANENGRYTTQQIEADAARIRGWRDAGRTVYVYYNNDWHGHAVDNATQLADLLGAKPPERPKPADELF
jgi:uncharacterized protein YecE (DUF72 family)